MLQGGVRGEDGIVGLNNGSGDLRSRVDGEFQLGLFAVINREALHEQGSETRASATTEGVEDQETLKAGALIGVFAQPIENHVDDLFADGVVATSVIVGRVLFAWVDTKCS